MGREGHQIRVVIAAIVDSSTRHRAAVLLAASLCLLECGRTAPFDSTLRTRTDGGNLRCFTPTDCDDHVACTVDECLPDGFCLNTPGDEQCDDGKWCTGDKRCDTTLGCIVTPRDCDDRIACHRSDCDEASRTCAHLPDHSLCPAGTVCGSSGCVDCLVTSDCDDGVPCTADCVAEGACFHVPTDLGCDDGQWCTGDKRCDATLGCVTTPRDCDDGIACHRNTCDEGTRTCKHEPDNSLCPTGKLCGPLGCVDCLAASDCDDGVSCTLDVCLADGVCSHSPDNAACDEGKWCTENFHCDPALGCIHTPRSCDDGIFCDVNSCDETHRVCMHTPDDSLCPADELCGIAGCGKFVYAWADTMLYEIQLPSGTHVPVGLAGFPLADIALLPSSTLYGVMGSDLVTVDRKTGLETVVVPLGIAESVDALEASKDGTLYGCGWSTIYSIDPTTGHASAIATLPDPLLASGDFAFLNGALFMTAGCIGCNSNYLVAVNPGAGTATNVGSIGYDSVFALASNEGVLYGLTARGEILRIDIATGAGTAVALTGLGFLGATFRPQ